MAADEAETSPGLAAAAPPAGESLIARHKKELFVLLALGITLAAPFLLRPGDEAAAPNARHLIIITPHNETIRGEFGRAFTRHMRAVHGEEVAVDWRTPGGTTEVAKVIASEYRAAFENYWPETGLGPWGAVVAESYDNRKLTMPEAGEEPTEGQIARAAFLDSDVGIGIDMFWGGGAYDFHVQAGAGRLVAADASGKFGITALRGEQPELFADDVIPLSVGGEPYRDESERWIGTCLSAFGICYNTDFLERVGIESPPTAWEDLGDGRYYGEIALADPTKSGSATKAFEMLIQQQMAEALKEAEWEAAGGGGGNAGSAGASADEDAAVAEGWERGLRLIQKISANARYFTDSASKIPLDVAQGNAGAGMCIDFYGRTFNERHRREDGSSRLQYITPVGGTSTGVDPIGMLRGAPSPDLAHRFMEFVLSPEGQRIWNYRPGEPGGPTKVALRRLPVRKDLYGPDEVAHFSDPDILPYETADAFTYRPEWTGRTFNPLRFLIRLMCVDNHHEQKEAWEALIENDFPPEATKAFHDLSRVTYAQVTGEIADAINTDNKLAEVQLARDLVDHFRDNYHRAAELARKGQ